MKKKFLNVRNVVVALFAAAILVMTVFGYISEAIDYIKQNFLPDNTLYDGSYVEMLDVGQGDSILLYSGGKAALIDTGIKSYADDIAGILKSKGIKELDLLLISHNHSDHMGGIVPLTEEFDVGTFVIPDLEKTDERTDKMRAAMDNVEQSGGECITARRGTDVTVGEFDISVIGAYYDEKDENDRSIIVKAKIGKWKFLFTGDAQEPTEKRLMADGADIKCDVLKVGHHGSMYGTSEEFLAAASPNLAMISCGRGNRYSHPHDIVLLRLQEAGVKYFRTDTNGNITFTVNEKEISVSLQKQ